MEYPEIKMLKKAVEEALRLLEAYKSKGEKRYQEALRVGGLLMKGALEVIKFVQENPLPERGPLVILHKLVPEAQGHVVFVKTSGKWELFEVDDGENLQKIVAALKQAKVACFAGQDREEVVNGQKFKVKFLLGVLTEHLQKHQGGV